MWLAVLLLSVGMIVIGALYIPAQKPIGATLIVLGILALILDATNWGPVHHVSLDRGRQNVVVV
jgi:hypothetical protein